MALYASGQRQCIKPTYLEEFGVILVKAGLKFTEARNFLRLLFWVSRNGDVD